MTTLFKTIIKDEYGATAIEYDMIAAGSAVAMIAGLFVLALATGMTVEAIGYHVLAGALVLVLAFACYARGWIGGGDAKLAASTALWFGFEYLYDYLLWASLLGGVLTLAI